MAAPPHARRNGNLQNYFAKRFIFSKDHDIYLAKPVLCNDLAIFMAAPKRVRERGVEVCTPFNLIWRCGIITITISAVVVIVGVVIFVVVNVIL